MFSACAPWLPTGETIDQQQVQVARKEDIIEAITRVAAKFRTDVGESVATRERFSTPLAEAATSSLDALKAYSLGMKTMQTEGHLRRHCRCFSEPWRSTRSLPRRMRGLVACTPASVSSPGTGERGESLAASVARK